MIEKSEFSEKLEAVEEALITTSRRRTPVLCPQVTKPASIKPLPKIQCLTNLFTYWYSIALLYR